MQTRRVAKFRSSILLFVLGSSGRLADLFHARLGQAVLDGSRRVGIDEVVFLESEPVDVDLKRGDGDDHDDHDDTTSKTRLGSLVRVLPVRQEEEQSSETNTLEVETDKDCSERFDVKHSSRLERVGLIGRPEQEVLVGGIEEDECDHCEEGDDGLNDRVDDANDNQETNRWPSGCPLELVHLVLFQESLSRRVAGENVVDRKHDGRDGSRVRLGCSGKGGHQDESDEEDRCVG